MYKQEWHYGCRVTVSDWIGTDADGKTPIRIGVEYFASGSSVNRPIMERVVYCPRSNAEIIENRLDSIVYAIISDQIPKNQYKEYLYNRG